MSSAATRNPDHAFFTWMALLALAVVVAGFAPSYYLKRLFGAPPLSPLLHLHGAAFTAWALLFVAQPLLARSGKLRLHRALGLVGIAVAVAMVVSGVFVVFSRPRLTVLSRATILWPLMSLLLFAAVVCAAIYRRHDAAIHKRLMLAAAAFVLPAAIGRIMIMYGSDLIPYLTRDLAAVLLLGPLAIYDLVRLRRLHGATLSGFAVHLAQNPVHAAVAYSEPWQTTASWLAAQLQQ